MDNWETLSFYGAIKRVIIAYSAQYFLTFTLAARIEDCRHVAYETAAKISEPNALAANLYANRYTGLYRIFVVNDSFEKKTWTTLYNTDVYKRQVLARSIWLTEVKPLPREDGLDFNFSPSKRLYATWLLPREDSVFNILATHLPVIKFAGTRRWGRKREGEQSKRLSATKVKQRINVTSRATSVLSASNQTKQTFSLKQNVSLVRWTLNHHYTVIKQIYTHTRYRQSTKSGVL